jgi:hypothetical protein
MTRGGRKPKLTREQVEDARIARSCGYTSEQIAVEFKVAGSTMRRYLRGQCKQHERAAA